MSKKTTKKALVMSVISLLACVSMLVGSTFAWFTDSVTSGMNTIAAGNLDVELLANGAKVDSNTKLFGEDILWEPGVVVYENQQVSNVGSLALKYQLSLNFGNENDLNSHKLSEVLKVAVIDKIADTATRAEVLEIAKDKGVALSELVLAGELEAETASAEQAFVIYWLPGDNDNLYNANNGQVTSDTLPLHIEFGVHLFATQHTFEEDSFDEMYDADAQLPVRPVSATTWDEVVALAAEGAYIVLENDISGDTTINMNGGCIDGNGHTMSFTASGSGAVMLNPTGGTIKNVKLVDPNANMFDNKWAIGSMQMANTTLTEDLYIENVDTSGFHLVLDMKADGHSIYVKDSEITNWMQVNGADVVSFEGCHFKADVAAQMTFNQPNSKQAIIFLMGDMTFTDCHFEENVNFYLDSAQYSGTVEFNNSTYGNNGVENRPIESFGFIQYWFPATGVYGYTGTFGDTKPAQTHFNWYINGNLVWDATAI